MSNSLSEEGSKQNTNTHSISNTFNNNSSKSEESPNSLETSAILLNFTTPKPEEENFNADDHVKYIDSHDLDRKIRTKSIYIDISKGQLYL